MITEHNVLNYVFTKHYCSWNNTLLFGIVVCVVQDLSLEFPNTVILEALWHVQSVLLSIQKDVPYITTTPPLILNHSMVLALLVWFVVESLGKIHSPNPKELGRKLPRHITGKTIKSKSYKSELNKRASSPRLLPLYSRWTLGMYPHHLGNSLPLSHDHCLVTWPNFWILFPTNAANGFFLKFRHFCSSHSSRFRSSSFDTPRFVIDITGILKYPWLRLDHPIATMGLEDERREKCGVLRATQQARWVNQ